MKNPKVRIYIRVKLPDGSQPFLDPVWSANRQIKKGWAIIDGTPKHFPGAVYYLRYAREGKRVWERLTDDPEQALAAKQKLDVFHAAVSVDLIQRNVPAPIATATPAPTPAAAQPAASTSAEDSPALKLTGAVDRYKEFLSLANKAPKTRTAYETAIDTFVKQCGDKAISDVTAHDLLRFADHLRKRPNSDRTVANKINYICTFLAHFACDKVMPYEQRPRFVPKEPDAYTQEELAALFAACAPEERFLFQFFLATGFRDQEAAFATWRDVKFDAKEITVRAKKHLGFTPKDHEERTAPLPDALLDSLRARRRERPDSLFILGNGQKPSRHMLRILKRAALRAKLNCGECLTKAKKSCRTHAVCGYWELHKFRRTYATIQHEAGVSAPTLQKRLGHSDLETTLRYLAIAERRSKEAHDKVNLAFGPLLTASVAAESQLGGCGMTRHDEVHKLPRIARYTTESPGIPARAFSHSVSGPSIPKEPEQGVEQEIAPEPPPDGRQHQLGADNP